MSDVVTPLLQWLNANPQLAGVATFIISAAESVAVIGTLVPGSITMTAIGTLAGAGIIPLYETILWAILGAVVGDGISYWLGYHYKDRLRNVWPFRQNPILLEKGEAFVHRYGFMSVFIGRFVGPVRAIVPLVAGMLGMRPLPFVLSNVISAIGWAPVYMLPGILLGAASLELPPDIAMRFLLVLFLMFLFTLLCLWIIYKLIWLIRYQIEQLLTRIWQALKKSKYTHITTVVLKHHNPKLHHGQLTLAFYFLLSTLLLVLLVSYVKFVGAPNIFINDAIYHLFRGLRTPSVDQVMLDITLLGQKQIVLPMVAVLFCWLLFRKRMRTAFHVLALGVLASGSVYVVKHLTKSFRPTGIFNSPETFSMPSGHTALATIVYMGIAFIIATTVRPSRRWLIYLPATLVALAVGISRLYLGAHWFTDVIAAWLLSASVLIIVILSYHREHERPLKLLAFTTVCLVTLVLSYGIYHHLYFQQLTNNYQMTDKPITHISLRQWWERDEPMPISRVSLFGIPSQYINVEWTGELGKIKKTLMEQGWSTPPARDWISTLHRVTDIKSASYLPLVSLQYNDRQPVLILARKDASGSKLFVIRLWESGYYIDDKKQPLWVGIVGIVPRSYSWIFHPRYTEKVEPTILLPKTATRWDKKLLKVNEKNGSRSRPSFIMLIKEK